MATTTSCLPQTVRVGATSFRARWGEPLRYLCASVAALGLDAGLLWALTAVFRQPVWLAGGIAYGAGLVLIYVLSVRWVFEARSVRAVGTEFLVFAGLGVIGLLLNSATLSIATAAGLSLPMAKALSAAIGFTTNFGSRKLILFSRAA